MTEYIRRLEQAFDESMNDDASSSFASVVAKALGYFVGFGSLMLYTPIVVRLCRQRHARGLVISTWWLKVFSYLLGDVYYVQKGYELSTYAEIVIITVEAALVLVQVGYYQQHYKDPKQWAIGASMALYTLYGFTAAPEALVATGQLSAVGINTAALVPQMLHNCSTKTKGDYSPLTALLSIAGCTIRIFTTVTLNGGDPVLLIGFTVGWLANGGLLGQIVYYGTAVEGLSLWRVLLADVLAGPANHGRPGGLASDVEGGGAYGGLYSDEDDGDSLSRLQAREAATAAGARHRPHMELPEVESGSLRSLVAEEDP